MTAGIAVAEHWPASKTTSNEKEMIQPSEFGASLSTRYWPVILRYSERAYSERAALGCRMLILRARRGYRYLSLTPSTDGRSFSLHCSLSLAKD